MLTKLLRLIGILALSAILNACSSDGSNDDPGSGSSSLDLNQQSFSAVADSSGSASFAFNLPAGSTAFQVAASAGTLNALTGPAGNLLQKSELVSSKQKGLTTDVPYISSNGITGGAYNVSYSASPGSSVALQVSSKADSNLSSGTLKLNIVLLGPVAGSDDVLDALDVALETLRITYSRAGITIDEQTSNFEGPAIAPIPGDPLYQNIVSAQRAASITVVLASNRKGATSNEFQYGIIGATPFPIEPTANSVVVIAIEDITGNQGTFDSDEGKNEKRLLGEEIGRFTAEALGLPPIVTIRGDSVVGSDDLSDTPSCLNEDACQEDASVRTNLMYPEPLERLDIVNSDDEDYPRDQFTEQQRQVLNNSVFVD